MIDVDTTTVVIPWLDHGIHSVTLGTSLTVTEWIAGSSPAMTTSKGEADNAIRSEA
jgi:hypothetical protein